MIEVFIASFATFFATIGPLDIGIIFAVISANLTKAEKKVIIFKSFFIANLIFLFFALIGEFVLNKLGISLTSLKVGGGILLLLVAIDLVFAQPSGGVSTTKEEKEEAIIKKDIAVFPLATPLIAGPGTLGALILFLSNQKGNFIAQISIMGALLIVMIIALVCMFLAEKVQKIFGISGMLAIQRVFGVVLAALAVEFIFSGIMESGIF